MSEAVNSNASVRFVPREGKAFWLFVNINKESYCVPDDLGTTFYKRRTRALSKDCGLSVPRRVEIQYHEFMRTFRGGKL